MTSRPRCATETKAAGGLGSIAEQEVDHGIDVLLGGGLGRFTQTITGGPDAGKTVVASAQGQGSQYVTDAAGLAGATRGQPVLGLFNASNKWTGPAAATGKGNTPAACTEGASPSNEPSLADMTTGSLGVLGTKDHTDLFDTLTAAMRRGSAGD